MNRLVAEVIAGALLFALGMAFLNALRPARVVYLRPDEPMRFDPEGTLLPIDPYQEDLLR